MLVNVLLGELYLALSFVNSYFDILLLENILLLEVLNLSRRASLQRTIFNDFLVLIAQKLTTLTTCLLKKENQHILSRLTAG